MRLILAEAPKHTPRRGIEGGSSIRFSYMLPNITFPCAPHLYDLGPEAEAMPPSTVASATAQSRPLEGCLCARATGHQPRARRVSERLLMVRQRAGRGY